MTLFRCLACSVLGLLSACSSDGSSSGGATSGGASSGGRASGGTTVTTGGSPSTSGGATSGAGLPTTGGSLGSAGAATSAGGGITSAGGATSAGNAGASTPGASGASGASGGAAGAVTTAGGGGTSTAGKTGTGAAGTIGSGGIATSGGGGSTSAETGGSSAGAGGGAGRATTGGSGGAAASGGASVGGSGSDPVIDEEGCPLTLEGFATLGGATSGGKGGPVVTVSTQADLEKYAASEGAYVIRVQGTITLSPAGREVPVKSNKSIIGLGTTAKINEGGFFLASGVNNVIFRNLAIGGTGHFAVDDPERKNNDWDGIQMDTAHHVWIDHVFFQDVYDGMIDVRNDSNFITLSWNRFKDHLKTVGIGWTTNLITQITLHHNWFDNCEKRNPNCDNAYCHSYNNILEGVDEQGSLAWGTASLRIENGVFRNSNRPWYAADSTAQVTQTGSLTENIMNSKSNGEAFKPNYPYKLDPANVLDELVKRCAGPRAALGR